jgi:hypothetical protein
MGLGQGKTVSDISKLKEDIYFQRTMDFYRIVTNDISGGAKKVAPLSILQ